MGSYPLHRLPFSSLILVEPTMMTRETMKEFSKNATMMMRSVEVAKSKRDIWPSREAAHEWMSHRSPWKRWDPRVLEAYVVRFPPTLYSTRYAHSPERRLTSEICALRLTDIDIPGRHCWCDTCNPSTPRSGWIWVPRERIYGLGASY